MGEKRNPRPERAAGTGKKEKARKPLTWKTALLIVIIAAVAVFVLAIVAREAYSKYKVEHTPPEIITVANLERIINVSELSTFTAVYNGIAQVNNEEKPEKVDFYVSYEARVTAGLDLSQVEISVDEENKAVTVVLPEVHINGVNVDISSLDYIFINDRSNTSAVSQRAYKACEEDAKTESESQEAILQLARENAVNVVTALVKPFMNDADPDYRLTVQ